VFCVLSVPKCYKQDKLGVMSERKLKDSIRCLLDRPTDRYNRPSGQNKLIGT
jgi:hypothetical protein